MSVDSAEHAAPDQGFRALLSLYAAAGGVDASRLPGFAPLPLDTALQVLTSSSMAEVSVAARLEALHELAKAGFPGGDDAAPGYEALAQTIVAGRDIDAKQLLHDLSSTALLGGFQRTTSRLSLLHHEGAFVGEDVCTTRRVTVGGRQAVWVFSEFETDAPFDHVATWLDPRNWSRWGHLFFREMAIVDSAGPILLPPPGTEHWHANFREVVQFPWRQLDTRLHCDYWREGDAAAGMTYDLDRSLDSQIDVDRGFILVNQAVPGSPPSAPGAASGSRTVLRVKALKIVGFTEDVWDYAAEWVCPFWTEWIRGAVEGGTSSRPLPPSHAPEGEGGIDLGETAEAWMSFLGDTVRPYVDLLGGVATRLTSKGYDPSDCIDDERRYWSMLAQDWARAWNHGLNTVSEVSRHGFDVDLRPPPRTTAQPTTSATSSASSPSAGTAAPAAAAPGAATAPRADEGTLIPVPGLSATDRPACSDLTSIEVGAATIPSQEIVVTVESTPDGAYAVRLRAVGTTAQAALYVGQLTIAPGGAVVPVQLYISRALRT